MKQARISKIVIRIIASDIMVLPSNLCATQGVERAQVVAELLSAQTSSAERGAQTQVAALRVWCSN